MLAWLVIFGLILLGLIFMLVEMLLLPGVTIGALLSVASFVGAIYVAFDALGSMAGVATIIASLALSLIAFFWAIRTGVWKHISLKEQVGGASSQSPAEKVAVGSRGVTMSRLSPMGSAKFGDVIIEAKSLDSFIDPKCEVEVVGYDNAAVVVKSIKK
ncbi:MAG: NfeD family protein [Rikenellaceae bacterium]